MKPLKAIAQLLPLPQTAPPALPVAPAPGAGSPRDRLVLSQVAQSSDGLEHLRKTVARIAKTGDGFWTANDGYCIDLSAKWRMALGLAGIETRMVIVDPSAGTASASTLAGTLAMGKTHAFLTFTHKGEEYILDPTIQQFIRGTAGSVPPIFIGTRDELAALFTREQERLQVEIDTDPNVGRHDPLAFTELVYGLGRYRGLRVELTD